MLSAIYLSTIEPGSGKAAVALGLIEYALRRTTKVGFFRPVIPVPKAGTRNEDIDLILKHFGLLQEYEASYSWFQHEIDELLSAGREDEILDRIIKTFKALEKQCDFVLVEGTDYFGHMSGLEFNFNGVIARNLGCPVLLLGSAQNRSPTEALRQARVFAEVYEEQGCGLAGVLINKADPACLDELRAGLDQSFGSRIALRAALPADAMLSQPRVREIATYLGAQVLFGHSRLEGLVGGFLIAAMQVQNALTHLELNQLVISPGDRADMLLGLIQADQSSNYPRLAGVVLSAGMVPEPSILRLIEGLREPLPILSVPLDTYATSLRAQEVRAEIAADDIEKITRAIQLFDDHVNLDVLGGILDSRLARGVTPKMFTYNLAQQARADRKRIVLPEGEDPRILRAAAEIVTRETAEIVLLGTVAGISEIVRTHGIPLDLTSITIIDPVTSPWTDRYAEKLYELRQAKGMTLEMARDLILDSSYFGTMMVYLGQADGMVSGAVHTTQDTIRPALQIIKTRPGFTIVSSVFFMCLNGGVVVYGDCAVNPQPSPEQLAEIAISSADTASAFGIDPRVALLSYSSGNSGTGEDVERVRTAARLAQTRRPDLLIEGPLQYDAAVDPGVAAQKMPGSKVAGQATVFVFPDLNTGNNTYKAVQRETGAIAIGPILQGLGKPVNDLSRGCTVEDIVNTVIITAIQAQSRTM